MIILGIDPGIALVGYGLIDFSASRLKCLEYGAIQTTPDQSLTERLFIIDQEMNQLIRDFQPDEMAVEELFYFKNQKTVILVAEARGVEVLAGYKNRLPIYEYTPLQVKQAITGYGRAGKKQMQQSVQALLRLDCLPEPDDAADALAIAITHAFGQRFKEENRLQ